MAQASSIERARELARARQQKRRALLKSAAPERSETARIQPAAAPTESKQTVFRNNRVFNTPPVHSTKHLESLGTTPEAFVGVPPPTENTAPPAPPSADAAEGAKAFGLAMGWMVNLALSDAMVRYGAEHLVSSAGAEGLPVGLNPETVPAAAAAFVAASAERVALKYGFGLRIPYQDEIVTIGAGAASGVYLLRKFTGRLPDPGKPNQTRTEATAPPSPDDGDGADENPFGKVTIGEQPAADVPAWMAR